MTKPVDVSLAVFFGIMKESIEKQLEYPRLTSSLTLKPMHALKQNQTKANLSLSLSNSVYFTYTHVARNINVVGQTKLTS